VDNEEMRNLQIWQKLDSLGKRKPTQAKLGTGYSTRLVPHLASFFLAFWHKAEHDEMGLAYD